MGDSKTFDAQFLIDGESRPKISLQKVPVNFGEHVKGKRSAGFLDFVHLFLELGEHGLAKQDLTNIFDLTIDEVSSHDRVRSPLKKIVSEQLFIESRGYFRQKDRIAVVLKEL